MASFINKIERTAIAYAALLIIQPHAKIETDEVADVLENLMDYFEISRNLLIEADRMNADELKYVLGKIDPGLAKEVKFCLKNLVDSSANLFYYPEKGTYENICSLMNVEP
jgi:hypothetical protein